MFDRNVLADQQIVLPLRFFSPANYHNIYTDIIRALILKSKCEILIDTFSNAVLPGTQVSYIHYPLLRRVSYELPDWKNKIYFYPYKNFLNFHRNKLTKKVVLANSEFTAEAVRAETGIESHVLYPSVSNKILNNNMDNFNTQRHNNVVTVARISTGKNLDLIPQIAKLTRRDISFEIAGLLYDKKVLDSLLRLIEKIGVSDRVKIITNVNRKKLRQMLFNSKVYLHPKVNEHFGISIVEGMAAGCIPVVHNSGGPREFVQQNQRFDTIEEAATIVEKEVDTWSPNVAKRVTKDAEQFGESNFSSQFIDIINIHFQ